MRPRAGRDISLELCVLAAALLLCCGTETTTSIQKLQKSPMTLCSPAFQHGGTIPDRYAIRSWNAFPPSPPLEWTNVPDGTRYFALILYQAEESATRRYGVPWLALNLPGDSRYLPEAAGSHGADAGYGLGSYMGMPRSRDRPHRFVFVLYALDAAVSCTFLPTGPTELEEAAAGHILAKAELACYTRHVRF